MKIGSIGYNYSHDSDFVMDRPNGVGCGLFLIVKTPALFEINGIRYDVKKGSVIIFTADVSCFYRAAEDTYCDDWMYFGLGADEVKYFENMQIPLNTIIHLGNIEELSQIMHTLAYEHYSAEKFCDEIETHYLEILFMKLSRIIQSKSYLFSETSAERNSKLTYFRSQFYTSPEHILSIDSMASETGLSRSGFQHLYKKMFGVSVMTDIINGRIERAKRLLSSTNLTVKEIALKCGYTGEYNFMRQFKSRCGKTPTEYRKCL